MTQYRWVDPILSIASTEDIDIKRNQQKCAYSTLK